MAILTVRNAAEVPAPRHTARAVLEAQLLYENFIKSVGSDVGELALAPNENLRAVKVRLRRAATRLGKDLDIWDVDGKVYFRSTTKRGRPRKNS